MATDDLTNPSEPEQRAHGAHGKGDGAEQRVDEARVEPASREAAEVREAASFNAREALDRKLTGRLSDAGFGDAPSGGSTVDKRPPGNK